MKKITQQKLKTKLARLIEKEIDEKIDENNMEVIELSQQEIDFLLNNNLFSHI